MLEREKQLEEWDVIVRSWLENKEELSENLIQKINTISKRWYNSTVNRVSLSEHFATVKEKEREKRRRLKSGKKVLYAFMNGDKNDRFEMLFSFENEERKKCETNEDKIHVNEGHIHTAKFIANENYEQLIDYVFSNSLKEEQKQILLDSLCIDAALIAMEKLVEPYLNGSSNIKTILPKGYSDEIFTELPMSMIPKTGTYKMELTKPSVFDIDDTVEKYKNLFEEWRIKKYKMGQRKLDKSELKEYEVGEEFWSLVGETLEYVPEQIIPFAVISLYIQYRRKLNNSNNDITIAIKEWQKDEIKVVPKCKKAFRLLKNETTLVEQFQYMYIDSNLPTENINILLNLYLFNLYFPLADVLLLNDVVIGKCNSRQEQLKMYDEIAEYVNIKPYFTKRFMLDNAVYINKELQFNRKNKSDLSDYLSVTAIEVINTIAECMAERILKTENEYLSEYDDYKQILIKSKKQKRYRHLYEDLNAYLVDLAKTLKTERDQSIEANYKELILELENMQLETTNNEKLKKQIKGIKKNVDLIKKDIDKNETAKTLIKDLDFIFSNDTPKNEMPPSKSKRYDKKQEETELIRAVYHSVRESKNTFEERKNLKDKIKRTRKKSGTRGSNVPDVPTKNNVK